MTTLARLPAAPLFRSTRLSLFFVPPPCPKLVRFGKHAGRACRLPLAWIQSRSCLRFPIRSSFRPLCSFRPFSSLQFASCSCAQSFYHPKTIHTTKTFIQVWTGEPVASNRSPINRNMLPRMLRHMNPNMS